MYNVEFKLRFKNKKETKNKNIPSEAILKTCPELKRRFSMLQEKKIESGPTLNTHNFHSSREKKTKWACMEPIDLYLSI
jgi:hypothetical protein